ncbi:CHAT domain-containing protein [Trichocoleus sp. FACHB-262]|uniref:CHAT domain-containing protein n=1 Tax=Trichocoleus sp. FACHB-262 TaxID=2692869 RepID=UPI001684B23D|nr:CHAT domain-containing protein [Trichocoleus sp. FACHB-262]MBD2123723.1 CHAT domain-containing protein [Trichocoleus sp. FACHB-262]
MPVSETPCLSLSIQRLAASGTNRYVIWVINAPYPSGYVLHDCVWPDTLTQAWQAWQEMFSLRGLPQVPHVSSVPSATSPPASTPEPNALPYGARLMQNLGVNLWQWLFDGPVEASINRSQGMAFGLGTPLRLRLEIRDPELIALPWEIMQSQMGRSVISIASDQILFSRTTSEVESLPALRMEQSLKVLLVLGQGTDTASNHSENVGAGAASPQPAALNLEQEAAALEEILTNHEVSDTGGQQTVAVRSQVDTLIQPTPAQLIEHLETGKYNIFFYAGHGVPAPDGGLLLLGPGNALNGTELAQVLTRCRVTLAVFNACWGAQPDHTNDQPIPRSSLAEVLIHHGVPAVLGMRDSITDQEALSFIRSFAQALRKSEPIDRAVALARQHLLMLYKFNQPAWTLPVLYMHPQFDGRLIHTEGSIQFGQDIKEDKGNNTMLPPEGFPSDIRPRIPMASLRLTGLPPKAWPIRDGVIRVGSQGDNDLVLPEAGVSRYHAKIFYRDASDQPDNQPAYILQDVSRYGTFILGSNGWRRIHQQEVSLRSGVQLKFGNPNGQALEFLIERPTSEENHI